MSARTGLPARYGGGDEAARGGHLAVAPYGHDAQELLSSLNVEQLHHVANLELLVQATLGLPCHLRDTAKACARQQRHARGLLWEGAGLSCGRALRRLLAWGWLELRQP